MLGLFFLVIFFEGRVYDFRIMGNGIVDNINVFIIFVIIFKGVQIFFIFVFNFCIKVIYDDVEVSFVVLYVYGCVEVFIEIIQFLIGKGSGSVDLDDFEFILF